MTNTRTYAELAQLSEAAYGNLVSNREFESAVKDPKIMTEPFSLTQAAELVERWSVITHQPNTDSGFSSTLFRNADDGGYVLAIRGTEGVNWEDLLETDFGDIAIDGIAIDQVIDLYNEWKRITSPGIYEAAYLEVLEPETDAYRLAKDGEYVQAYGMIPDVFLSYLRSRNDILIEEPGETVKTIKFAASDTLFDIGRATGLGKATDIALNGLTVTGHSLGGHLAAAFTRLFSGIGAEALTVNGAGFWSGNIGALSGNAAANIRNLFHMLGGAPDFSAVQILNLFGDKNLQFVTMDGPLLYQQGLHQAIFIEQDSVPGDTLGHAAAQMTDSLAVYDLFMTLESGFGGSPSIESLATLKRVFESGTNQANESLESLVNAVSDVLNVDTRIPVADIDSREALYTAVYSIRESDAFENMAGKFSFKELVEPHPAEARTDFGHFLSLYFLVPFEIEPRDPEAAEQLRLLHGELGDAWEQEQSRTPEQRAQGFTDFSDKFLEDRALLMRILLRINSEDLEHGELSDSIKFTVLGRDGSDALVVDADKAGYPWFPSAFDYARARYVFGSDAAESPSSIMASVHDDHLYGMGGNDTISGLDGSDYIEGGVGSDVLRGNDDDDILMGGAGSDSLTGDRGRDSLMGGFGTDRFYWSAGDGDDVIGDSDDADDRIVVNGTELSTLDFKQLSPDSPFYISDTHPAITLHFDGGSLTVDIGSGLEAGSITVLHYNPDTGSDYGIILNNYIADPNPATNVVVAKLGFSDDPVANQTDPLAYSREIFTQRGINWAVSTITFYAPNVSNYSGGSLHGTMGGAFEGGPVDDFLTGNANQNALHGLAGDDRIEGRDGDDFLEGGAGADRLFGGAGNDVLFGSARAGLFELNSGPTPHDKYYQPQVADAESDVNVLAGDSGNDFISGGEYQDYMDGGTGGDRLLGGTGADFISGGADTDFIYGDSALDFRYVELTPGIASERFEIEFANGIAHEGDYNDVLHGGDGADALWGEVGDDELYGENGNDNLFGDRVNIAEYFAAEFPAMAGTTPDLDVAQHGNDKLFGGAGRDLVQGMGGNDELTGGTEDDDLDGGAGDDAFLFEAGDGRDRIRDTQGLHNLVFSGIPLADLRVRFRGADVFVGRAGTDEGFFLSRAEWSDIRLALETPDGIIERSRVDTEYYDGAGNLLLRVKGTNSVTEAGLASVMTVDAADPERPKLVIKEGIEGVRLEAIAGGAGGGRVRVTSAGMSFDTELSAYLLQSGGEYLSLANGQALAVVGFSGVMPASSASDWIVGSESADTMSSGNGNDVLDGRGGNDMLDGGDGSDFLAGGNGDDRLSGGQSTNYFDGGRGSDTLIGGATYDSYRFIAGDGTDTIVDGGGQHGFDFGAGVTPASVALYYTSTTDTSFRLQYGQGDAIVSQGGTAAHWISSVKVNGAPMSLVQRSDLVNGTFRDTRWHDTFEPGAGDDTLFIRGWGNDVLRLAPGGGQDVVKVEQDLIISPLKGAIQFAAGIDLNTITFSFSNADAVINYGTGNKVTLDTATVTSPRDNTLVRFTLRSEADSNWFPVIRAQGSSAILYGTYGKDRILGGNGDDTILPGYGDDIVEAGAGEDRVVLNELYIRNASGGIGHKSIRGGGGNDVTETPLHQGLTFHYDRGDGNDFIMYDWSYASKLPYLFTVNYAAATAAFVPNGEDALSFGAGIALADLRFVRYGDSLAIQLKDGSGSIRITDFFHAWDAVRGPNVGSELLALVGDSRELDGDTLLHPTVLAALPRTPIANLKFQDGSVVALAPVLESQLEQGVATVLGTEGDDYLHGTEVDEIIHLLGGDDYFDADEGSNTIDAGKGDDTIDVEGSHIIVAGEGDDDVTAMGNNIIDAGAGRDTVWVSGDNFVDPGAGIDWITLRGGHNVLRFGPGYGDDSFEFTVRDGLDSTVVEMAEGLTIDDLLIETFFEDGGDIIQISLPFTDDVLTLRAEVADADGNGFSRHPHATVTAIRFSDGSEITGEELFALNPSPPTVIQGTNGIDWLAGTEGNEDFYGGRGNDLMYGAGGNDYFYIEGHDQGEDRIVGGTGWDFIFGGEGADTITLTDFLATDSVEKIDGDTGLNAIAGTAARNVFDFTGTALLGINHIDTRAGDDDVRGSHGNDVFVGGLGNDIVRGVGGNDIYLFGRGHGRDSIANYAPLATETDCLWLYDIAPEQLWFSQSGFDLLIDVVGTSDQVRVINWYYTEDRQLDTIYARDQVLQRNQVQQLVNAMAAFDAPTGAGAVIPPAVQDQLEPTLAAAWHLAA